jgi:hypothetical protein
MKNYTLILLLLILNLQAEQANEPKLEIGKMDVTDFPYFYKYKRDRFGDSPNEKQREEILSHWICKILSEKYKLRDGTYDLEKLNAIARQADKLAYEMPIDSLGNKINHHIEPQTKKLNDQAMAIVNCVQVLIIISEAQQAQKKLNDLLD